jgi:hypothetical protein
MTSSTDDTNLQGRPNLRDELAHSRERTRQKNLTVAIETDTDLRGDV